MYYEKETTRPDVWEALITWANAQSLRPIDHDFVNIEIHGSRKQEIDELLRRECGVHKLVMLKGA